MRKFLEAVKRHEYKGYGSGGGHFQELLDKEAEEGMDGSTAIEDNWKTPQQGGALVTATDGRGMG